MLVGLGAGSMRNCISFSRSNNRHDSKDKADYDFETKTPILTSTNKASPDNSKASTVFEACRYMYEIQAARDSRKAKADAIYVDPAAWDPHLKVYTHIARSPVIDLIFDFT